MSRYFFRRRILVKAIVLTFIVLAFIAVGWPLGYAVDSVLRGYFGLRPFHLEYPTFWYRIILGVFSTMLMLDIIVAFPVLCVKARRSRLRMIYWSKRLSSIKASEDSDFKVLYSAGSIHELIGWLRADEMLLSQARLIRGFSSFVLDAVRTVAITQAPTTTMLPACLEGDEQTTLELHKVRQILEERFERAT